MQSLVLCPLMGQIRNLLKLQEESESQRWASYFIYPRKAKAVFKCVQTEPYVRVQAEAKVSVQSKIA